MVVCFIRKLFFDYLISFKYLDKRDIKISRVVVDVFINVVYNEKY